MALNKNLITILTLALVIVLAWVGLEIRQVISTTTIPPTTQELILPLNPEFDQETLSKIKANAMGNR
jgi:hypothetical protein